MCWGSDIGFEGICRRAIGGMGHILHADGECMRDAIAWPDDLRDLSEKARREQRDLVLALSIAKANAERG